MKLLHDSLFDAGEIYKNSFLSCNILVDITRFIIFWLSSVDVIFQVIRVCIVLWFSVMELEFVTIEFVTNICDWKIAKIKVRLHMTESNKIIDKK